VEDGAEIELAKCTSLKSLRFVNFDLSVVLPLIGENLVSLEIGYTDTEDLELIDKYCLNLKYLEISGCVAQEEIIDLFKKGLVKLAKLNVNGESIRLGKKYLYE
jgi:hypothetical protein